MKPTNVKDYLPIIIAFGEGKTIQYFCQGKWRDSLGELDFIWPPDHYRIKPEPTYKYKQIYKDGSTTYNISPVIPRGGLGYIKYTYENNILTNVELVKHEQ